MVNTGRELFKTNHFFVIFKFKKEHKMNLIICNDTLLVNFEYLLRKGGILKLKVFFRIEQNGFQGPAQ